MRTPHFFCLTAISIFATFFFVSTAAAATWTSVQTPTTENIMSIAYINATHVLAVSYSGAVLVSTNAGSTWHQVTSVPAGTAHLSGISFDAISNQAYAVGSDKFLTALIWGSSDGGSTWKVLTSPVSNRLNSVAAGSHIDAIAVGGAGSIIKTGDGGASWNIKTSGVTATLYRVRYGAQGTVWAVGASGTILKSTDNGETWAQVISGTTADLYDVYFDGNIGFVVGHDGTVLRTANGGASWMQLPALPNDAGNFDAPAPPKLESIADFSDGAFSVMSTLGTIYTTYNAGSSWVTTVTPHTGVFLTVAADYFSLSHLLVGTYDGSIAQVTIPVPPYQPASVTGPVVAGGTTTNAQPTIQWVAATAVESSIASYEVKTNDGAYVSVGNVLSYTPSAALANGTYTFSVRALSDAGAYSLPTSYTLVVAVPAVVTPPAQTGAGIISANNSQMYASTGTVVANSAGYAVLTVIARDSLNNPLANQSVAITSSRPTNDTIILLNAVTNADGFATFQVSSNAAGTSVYSASTGGVAFGNTSVTYSANTNVSVPVTQPPAQTPQEAAVGSLIKLNCAAGAGVNDPCRAVYFIDGAGKRHAFPNAKIYASWFANFDSVQTVDAVTMASYPLGKNVAYRPGARMVKFITNPVVYVVTAHGVLRAVGSAAVAAALYGATWNKQIDDLSDAFAGDYSYGAAINGAVDYSLTVGQMGAGGLVQNF